MNHTSTSVVRVRGKSALVVIVASFWMSDSWIPTARAAQALASAPSYGQRIAICVGINEYSEYGRLNYAVNDAVAMATVFESYGFDRVILLKNQDATREAVLRHLEEVRTAVQEEDFVVFFFAGHGITLRDPSGNPKSVLIPYGARRGHETDDAIPMAKVTAWARDLKARHTLLLMDACYSGLEIESRTPHLPPRAGSTQRMARPVRYDARTLEILTAGGEMDRAFEFDGHGLFTRCLLDCLTQGSPQAADGFVTGRELAAAVRERVAAETGGWQTPQFASLGDGDCVLRPSVLVVLASAPHPGTIR